MLVFAQKSLGRPDRMTRFSGKKVKSRETRAWSMALDSCLFALEFYHNAGTRSTRSGLRLHTGLLKKMAQGKRVSPGPVAY